MFVVHICYRSSHLFAEHKKLVTRYLPTHLIETARTHEQPAFREVSVIRYCRCNTSNGSPSIREDQKKQAQ